ncbi:MAG TPA: DUF6474 family protein [Pseudonocardia sp.]|jgi:hypothetical protein|nr:DUF6474 family protein [Pseudonocardia sp.]
MKRRRAQAADESDQARNLSDKITPSNAKRAIAVGKVLAPVLLPIAMRAAGAARGAWDDRRARRLGVAPSELTSYSGKGGALHARIDGIASSLLGLRAAPAEGDRAAAVNRFVTATEPRLIDLAAAVRAAELMPTERRRAAHRAVASELDRIEPELLKLLGVSSPGPADVR